MVLPWAQWNVGTRDRCAARGAVTRAVHYMQHMLTHIMSCPAQLSCSSPSSLQPHLAAGTEKRDRSQAAWCFFGGHGANRGPRGRWSCSPPPHHHLPAQLRPCAALRGCTSWFPEKFPDLQERLKNLGFCNSVSSPNTGGSRLPPSWWEERHQQKRVNPRWLI